MNKFESRYFQTSEKIDEALIRLLDKKTFEYITVKELCTEAGVNRSTFYLHYENTRDVLEETAEKLIEKFLSYFPEDPHTAVNAIAEKRPEELVFMKPEYIIPYLTFIKENKNIFCVALKNYDNFNFEKTYSRLFHHVFDPILKKFDFPEEDRKYVMMFYLSGINSLVTEWLNSGCKESTEHISKIIIKCIMDKRENCLSF